MNDVLKTVSNEEEMAKRAPEFDFESKVATIATLEDHLMSTVGVKELKNCLTQYLRRTKQGEEVIVTERGNPIALIQPIKSAEKAVSLEARLDLRRRVLWRCQPGNL
jgi:prevent-host-death family protein